LDNVFYVFQNQFAFGEAYASCFNKLLNTVDFGSIFPGLLCFEYFRHLGHFKETGQPSPIDPDLHFNPIRYTGSDCARPPSTDDKSDADQAPPTKQVTAKDKPEPREPFFLLYLFHTT
jgi:hypothetical protein